MVDPLNSMYDVQQKLKQFGVFVYTGSRLSDLQLIDLEIKELYKYSLITKEEFMLAKMVIHREIQAMQNR